MKEQTSAAALALGRLIGAHAELTRELNVQLTGAHGLSLGEFEVLLLLSKAPERSMRRIDLSRQVRLSPSGVTRLLDRLEEAGLVGKGSCAEDARVTYAVLTDAGAGKLEASSRAHLATVERLLGERFDADELASLADLLGRLSDPADDERCPTT